MGEVKRRERVGGWKKKKVKISPNQGESGAGDEGFNLVIGTSSSHQRTIHL